LSRLRIPPMLHDIFGEQPTTRSILTILLFGGGLTAALYVAYPDMTNGLSPLRIALALLLMFDVFCGCLANFTASTSNYYATRSIHRIVFIAVHVHIVLVALLLDADLWYSIGVWAYTMIGACIVNALIGRPSQRFAAGFFLSIGLACMPVIPDVSPYMRIVGTLFMLKVMFAFAVDHYGEAMRK